MKHFNNNNTDDKTKGKISNIRTMLSTLGNTVTNNDRKKITKELYEKEKKENLSDKEKEENLNYLVNLKNTLNKKEEYKYHDRDDLDYYGIRDIENLFGNVDVDDDNYCKPILVKSSCKNNYKYYESWGDRDKKLSVKQDLYKIMPYLIDLINDHKTIRNESNEWKNQLNIHVNFVYSNDTGEIRTIFVWRDNKEIRSGNETDDVFKGLFSQKKEAILRNGSNFVLESVDLLSYSFHKKSLRRGRSYIKSPEWVFNKRATINPKNKDNNCFQYSKSVALNHQNIGNHPERISNIKPFTYKYNWDGIDF